MYLAKDTISHRIFRETDKRNRPQTGVCKDGSVSQQASAAVLLYCWRDCYGVNMRIHGSSAKGEYWLNMVITLYYD